MWRDIFFDNSANIIKLLEDFSENLDGLKKAIEDKNGDKLLKILHPLEILEKKLLKLVKM